MAKRRMFSLDIVDTDTFLDMPASTQNLYFHLGMRADDDGFIASPRKITALAGCSADDMRLLVAKGYIIPFDSGVCVIRDWKVNNYLQSDRYTPSRYTVEKQSLIYSANKPYELSKSSCIQNVYETYTQVSIGKDSIDKGSIDKNSKDKNNKEYKVQYRKGVNNNTYSRTDNKNGVSQWNIDYDIDGTKI